MPAANNSTVAPIDDRVDDRMDGRVVDRVSDLNHARLGDGTYDRMDGRIDSRLTDLEIKASFAEDLVEQLNQIIVRQQQELETLARQIGQLRAQLPQPGTGTARTAQDELPPHY